MAIAGSFSVKTHVNPRVYTSYNAMTDGWDLQLMCCEQKAGVFVTAELLVNIIKTPGSLAWELFRLFREFIPMHPFTRQLIMKLTHGNVEKNVSNEFINFGGAKYNYSGYDIQWNLSPEFYSMSTGEAAFWDKQMDEMGFTEEKKNQFFGTPMIVNSEYSDIYDSISDYSPAYHPGGLVHNPGIVVETSHSVGRDQRVDQLPGIKETVKHPVYKTTKKELGNGITGYWRLEAVIIDLNDQHNWTREQIADWLETLDIDIRFRGEDSDDEHS